MDIFSEDQQSPLTARASIKPFEFSSAKPTRDGRHETLASGTMATKHSVKSTSIKVGKAWGETFEERRKQQEGNCSARSSANNSRAATPTASQQGSPVLTRSSHRFPPTYLQQSQSATAIEYATEQSGLSRSMSMGDLTSSSNAVTSTAGEGDFLGALRTKLSALKHRMSRKASNTSLGDETTTGAQVVPAASAAFAVAPYESTVDPRPGPRRLLTRTQSDDSLGQSSRVGPALLVDTRATSKDTENDELHILLGSPASATFPRSPMNYQRLSPTTTISPTTAIRIKEGREEIERSAPSSPSSTHTQSAATTPVSPTGGRGQSSPVLRRRGLPQSTMLAPIQDDDDDSAEGGTRSSTAGTKIRRESYQRVPKLRAAPTGRSMHGNHQEHKGSSVSSPVHKGRYSVDEEAVSAWSESDDSDQDNRKTQGGWICAPQRPD